MNGICDRCGLLAVRREKMRSHIEAVHGNGDFDVKAWIRCGRSSQKPHVSIKSQPTDQPTEGRILSAGRG